MKKDREVLERVLNELFENYCANKEVENKLKKDLAEHGVTTGTVVGILNKQIPIETQSQVVLYLITKSLFHATEESKINPEQYFTNIEIEEGNKFKREIPKVLDYFEIENVIPVKNDQWIGVLSFRRIAELVNEGRIFYNKSTQRNTIIKEFNNRIVESININKTAIKEIKESMMGKRYRPNTLTINILKTGEEKFEYNKRNNTITIYENVDIIDGFHRLMSIGELMVMIPDFEENMEVRITNLTIEQAREFIVQEDKRTPINKKYIQSISTDKFSNIIVRELNELAKNELRGKITDNTLLYTKNQAYVLNTTLIDAIEIEYPNIKNQREADTITDFLREGFNEIIGIYFDEFSNLENSRKNNAITMNNTFIGYVALLKNIQGLENWKKELEKKLKKLDLSLSNEYLSNLDIEKTTISKTNMKKIGRWFLQSMEG